MKKIIGVLGVAVIAATMFFSANNANGFNSDTSLASLITMNEAHAGAEGCQTNPEKDKGDCVKNISGTSWNCVTSSLYSNCFAD
ncbi:hypothetical protein [Flavobacterium daejeonense]|uniref:hypothetical protein n=1 Tax=Flavobacterium daejeonense TaxID=350893 RepID=UPI00047EA3A3|nr:hypothetical protein [Flavobacterium daejeonense]